MVDDFDLCSISQDCISLLGSETDPEPNPDINLQPSITYM